MASYDSMSDYFSAYFYSKANQLLALVSYLVHRHESEIMFSWISQNVTLNSWAD